MQGKTWNPVTGCTKISAGCQHCYAERMSKRLAGRFGYPADEPFRVTLHPDKIDKPLHWKKPRKVFVCSMGDLFHEDVPDEFIDKVFAVMALSPRHTFQVLTKRPDRMAGYMAGDWKQNPGQRSRPHLINHAAADMHRQYPFASDDFLDPGRYPWPPENVQLLTSCENQEMANLRIPHLLKCPGAA